MIVDRLSSDGSLLGHFGFKTRNKMKLITNHNTDNMGKLFVTLFGKRNLNQNGNYRNFNRKLQVF